MTHREPLTIKYPEGMTGHIITDQYSQGSDYEIAKRGGINSEGQPISPKEQELASMRFAGEVWAHNKRPERRDEEIAKLKANLAKEANPEPVFITVPSTTGFNTPKQFNLIGTEIRKALKLGGKEREDALARITQSLYGVLDNGIIRDSRSIVNLANARKTSPGITERVE